MTLIEDGKGTGSKVRIDANNRMHIEAVQENEGQHAVGEGDAYNINSGSITFSAAGTLLYLVNNEDKDLVIDAVAVGAGGASVSDMGEVTIERNITAGDVISDATAVSMNANRNFGSNKALAVTTYKGKSGGTSTGGVDLALLYHGVSGRMYATIDLVIPKGSNISVTYDPKLSSGTIKAYCAFICHLKDPESAD